MSLLAGRCLCSIAIAISLAACTRENPTDNGSTEVNSAPAAYDGQSSGGYTEEPSQSAEEGAMNSWDLDGSGPPSSDDSVTNSSMVTAASSSKVWVGMSGVPQGCTLTNYRNVDDARIVMEQRGAKILEQTPDMVIVLETSPKGQLKTVFATDEGMCSALVAQRGFSEAQDAATTPADDGPDK